jgi:hypothetical protein
MILIYLNDILGKVNEFLKKFKNNNKYNNKKCYNCKNIIIRDLYFAFDHVFCSHECREIYII